MKQPFHYFLALYTFSFLSLSASSPATPPAPTYGEKGPLLPPKEAVEAAKQVSLGFEAVAAKVTPGVVFIVVELDPNEYDAPFGSPFGDPRGSPFDDGFFGFPFGKPQPPTPKIGTGSGFIVSSNGYIMTNAHVIRDANKIEVKLYDETSYSATVIGSDPNTDIAVLKIEGENFPYLALGDSDQVKIGQSIIAIGSPFQLTASVTTGVVSGIKRHLDITNYGDYFQCDAAINPGNSGGPSLNLDGEVVGINTAILSNSGGYMGIGLAIPINLAKMIMNQIIKQGYVTRGYLGITLQTIDKDLAASFGLERTEGALIAQVSKDSPAEKAGLKEGDIILEYNNTPIKSYRELRNAVASMEPGSELLLKINRKGKILNISVKLGSLSTSNEIPGVFNNKIGIHVENLTPDLAAQQGYAPSTKGVIIVKVRAGSPAAKVGLTPGTLILKVGEKEVNTVEEYHEQIKKNSNNKTILFQVEKNRQKQFVSIRME